MHLGLARAQLLPRSDGYRRFTGSPIDALVYLVIGCGLRCQIPIRLALHPVIHRRITLNPQRWPACWRDVWGFGLYPDVFEYLPDIDTVGDERNQAHLPTAHGAQQREDFVDSGNQHRPQVVRWALDRCSRFWCRRCGRWGRFARCRHPRYAHARARLCSLHRGWLHRSRLGQHGNRCPQRRVGCQHAKVAVPVGTWWGYQRGNALNQLQRCEV